MRKKLHIVVLLIIPFSFFIVTYTVPFFYGISVSFHSPKGDFIGISNYLLIFRDARFLNAIKYSLVFSASTTVSLVLFGLIFGIVIHHLNYGRSIVKTAILIPWAISMTVWGLLAQIVLHDHFGLVNFLLLKLGIIRQGIGWLSDPALARFSAIAVRVYREVWFGSLLFLSARQIIPEEFYDEARVSGARPSQTLWFVTLPILKPTVLYIATLVLIFSFQEFDLVFALTQGGPGFATELASITVFQLGVRYGKFEYGTAAITVWSLFVTTIVVIFFRFFGRKLRDQ